MHGFWNITLSGAWVHGEPNWPVHSPCAVDRHSSPSPPCPCRLHVAAAAARTLPSPPPTAREAAGCHPCPLLHQTVLLPPLWPELPPLAIIFTRYRLLPAGALPEATAATPWFKAASHLHCKSPPVATHARCPSAMRAIRAPPPSVHHRRPSSPPPDPPSRPPSPLRHSCRAALPSSEISHGCCLPACCGPSERHLRPSITTGLHRSSRRCPLLDAAVSATPPPCRRPPSSLVLPTPVVQPAAKICCSSPSPGLHRSSRTPPRRRSPVLPPFLAAAHPAPPSDHLPPKQPAATSSPPPKTQQWTPPHATILPLEHPIHAHWPAARRSHTTMDAGRTIHHLHGGRPSFSAHLQAAIIPVAGQPSSPLFLHQPAACSQATGMPKTTSLPPSQIHQAAGHLPPSSLLFTMGAIPSSSARAPSPGCLHLPEHHGHLLAVRQPRPIQQRS